MDKLFRTDEDQWFVLCNRSACIHGGVPLFILFSEQCNDDIGFLHQHLGAQIIDCRSGIILIIIAGLFSEDVFTDVVGKVMIGLWSRECKRQMLLFRFLYNRIPPIIVDLSCQIYCKFHIIYSLHIVATSIIYKSAAFS